jgi:uncharacterized protein YkwD
MTPVIALFFGFGTGGCSDATVEPEKSQANPIDPEESGLLYELNRFREDAGIAGALIVCKSLNQSASAHSDDMRDKGYLSDTAPDGSTPRSRACAAGYKPACDGSAVIAEVVGAGFAEGKATLLPWTQDENTTMVLTEPSLIAAGVGRSLGADQPMWTLDLTTDDDPSCD